MALLKGKIRLFKEIVGRTGYKAYLSNMNEGKFLTLWAKYLPAIRILLKKSFDLEQKISLSKMELHSVDNRKNANYSFSLEISKGKLENSIGVAAIGKDLFYLLSKDAAVSAFMSDKNIMIQMTRAAQLTLKTNVVVENLV